MARNVLACLFVFAICGTVCGEEPHAVFRAGAYAQDITPTKFPISVNGGFSDIKAKSAHDRLHARCLVLDDGTTKVAIVVVDSCMIPRDLIAAARAIAEKQTKILAKNILISATHTHTAPTLAPTFQSNPDPDYRKFLVEKIATGIEKANTALAPAKVAWAVGQEPKQLFNRRWKMNDGVLNTDPFGGTRDLVRMNPPRQSADLLEPAGPVDPAVTVLSVQSLEGKPLALFANYSLHYVGDLPPLSADYFGVFADVISQKLGAGPPFMGMLSNGTSGDVNNINFKEPAPKLNPGERSRLVADAVADAAIKGLAKKDYHSQVRLGSYALELRLPVRKPNATELQRAQAILSKAQGRVLKTSEEVYANETTSLAKYPDTVEIELQLIRVGELAIVAIPCEVFTEIGLEIKKLSPFTPTCVVSLANGYNGYLPTPAQHTLGGYETWRARSSYLGEKSSEEIVKGVEQLFRVASTEK